MKTIPFGFPIIEEEEKNAVMEVLNGPMLTHGPRVREFEATFAAFTKARHAIATASCTAALHLTYFYLGVGPGDEVIVPAQTHVATAHAVELCGGRPVFVDSEKHTGNIDIDQIEEHITDRTRAISVVHYLGMPVNMERLLAIARKHNLFVVEDCALALGTYFRGLHAGLYGDVGCFSFYPVKHITTVEGGMLITNRSEVAEAVAKQRAFGIDRNVVSERNIPGIYDVQMIGLNYRLNEIGAAIGLVQMKRLPDFLRRRQENYIHLRQGLTEIEEMETFQSSHDEYQSSCYCFSMILKAPLHNKRFELVESLRQKGVGTSIYYPQPVPHMGYYKAKYGYRNQDFPAASMISTRSIALPVGPHVSADDIDYMVSAIKDTIAEVKSR